MSGINEFNSIQPEQTNIMNHDKKTGKKILFRVVLTALVISAAAAFGFTFNKYKDDPYGALIEQVGSEISLNAQQKEEVGKIKDAVNAKIENKKITHVKSGAEIEKLFRSDSFDRQKAMEIANSQEADDRELAVSMVDELEKLHNVLTTEQRNKSVDKVKELYSKFKKMK